METFGRIVRWLLLGILGVFFVVGIWFGILGVANYVRGLAEVPPISTDLPAGEPQGVTPEPTATVVPTVTPTVERTVGPATVVVVQSGTVTETVITTGTVTGQQDPWLDSGSAGLLLIDGEPAGDNYVETGYDKSATWQVECTGGFFLLQGADVKSTVLELIGGKIYQAGTCPAKFDLTVVSGSVMARPNRQAICMQYAYQIDAASERGPVNGASHFDGAITNLTTFCKPQ